MSKATTLPEALPLLSEPFSADHLSIRPGATWTSKTKNRPEACILAYIDGRAGMTRLDEVVGPENWSTRYELTVVQTQRVLNGGEIVAETRYVAQCYLTVLGVTKCGIGEGGVEDEAAKSAESDAFKRAGVPFGIGRYLYEMPFLAWPFDPSTKKFVGKPWEIIRLVYELSADICKGNRIDMRAFAANADLAAEGKPLYASGAPPPAQPSQPQAAQSAAGPGQPGLSGTDPACEACGKPIEANTTAAGKTYSPEQMAGYSRRDCAGHAYCKKCKQAHKDGTLQTGQLGATEPDPFEGE